MPKTLNSHKIEFRQVDPKSPTSFEQVLQGSDACVNATIRHTNLSVMEACLKTGTHYTDMGGLFFVTRKQLELHERYAQAGLSAVLGMGSAPGIPIFRRGMPPNGWTRLKPSTSMMGFTAIARRYAFYLFGAYDRG